jgi:hypothetical protein
VAQWLGDAGLVVGHTRDLAPAGQDPSKLIVTIWSADRPGAAAAGPTKTRVLEETR